MKGYDFDSTESVQNAFYFTTEFGLAYEVLFEQSGYIFPDDPDLDSHVFELVIKLIINTTGKRTPSDPRIAATIAEIFNAFLARNERIIVYICDSSDLRQVARARKFDGWYEYYRGIDFIKINRNIVDPSGEIYLTALIIRHDNPNKVRIFDAFDRLTSGQQGEKP